MKNLYKLSASFLALVIALLFSTHNTVMSNAMQPELTWQKSYDETMALAKKENKPIFMFFTGSDWCKWCKKMDKEILTSEDFINLVGNEFIFIKIDFPDQAVLADNIREKNDSLKEQYAVNGFPTIILLDPNGTEFARLNYRAGGGKSYADYVMKVKQDHQQFLNDTKNLKNQTQSQLENLYEKAGKLGLGDVQKQILATGLQNEDSLFFMKEQYRTLVVAGKLNDRKTQALRAKLLAKDPQNRARIHYDIAIIDFEALARNIASMKTADATLKPLFDYLAQFGERDIKNRWKIEMLISQMFQSKNQTESALEFAKASHKHAPAYLRDDIAAAISNLENEMRAIGNTTE